MPDFATFLGFVEYSQSPTLGAMVATLAIFTPGFLLVLAFLNNWKSLSQKPKFSAAMLGINAAVVGLLMAALYQPIFINAVTQAEHMVLVILGVLLLKIYKWSVMRLLMITIVTAWVLSFIKTVIS